VANLLAVLADKKEVAVGAVGHATLRAAKGRHRLEVRLVLALALEEQKKTIKFAQWNCTNLCVSTHLCGLALEEELFAVKGPLDNLGIVTTSGDALALFHLSLVAHAEDLLHLHGARVDQLVRAGTLAVAYENIAWEKLSSSPKKYSYF
jgi:hypothetical protein